MTDEKKSNEQVASDIVQAWIDRTNRGLCKDPPVKELKDNIVYQLNKKDAEMRSRLESKVTHVWGMTFEQIAKMRDFWLLHHLKLPQSTDDGRE